MTFSYVLDLMIQGSRKVWKSGGGGDLWHGSQKSGGGRTPPLVPAYDIPVITASCFIAPLLIIIQIWIFAIGVKAKMCVIYTCGHKNFWIIRKKWVIHKVFVGDCIEGIDDWIKSKRSVRYMYSIHDHRFHCHIVSQTVIFEGGKISEGIFNCLFLKNPNQIMISLNL